MSDLLVAEDEDDLCPLCLSSRSPDEERREDEKEDEEGESGSRKEGSG